MAELIIKFVLCIFLVAITCMFGAFMVLGLFKLIDQKENTVVDSENKNGGDQ